MIIDGRAYMDGGVVNNAAVSHAVALGATTVYVLPTGWSCSLERPPAGAIAMALHGLSVLVQHRLPTTSNTSAASSMCGSVPPPCPIKVGPADFSHARELIDQGRASATAWLSHQGEVDVSLLRPHDHPMPTASSLPGTAPGRRSDMNGPDPDDRSGDPCRSGRGAGGCMASRHVGGCVVEFGAERAAIAAW